MATDEWDEKVGNDEPEEESMDQMKKIDSMEDFNHLQKLQNRILQRLIEKIDKPENIIKPNNR